MGFFNLLESAFFVSLAITFVLIVMLVYHFKERLVTLEKKNDTMFEILNRVVKELKHMQENKSSIDIDMNQAFSSEVSSSVCPVNVFSMFNVGSRPTCNIQELDTDDDDEDDDEEDEESIHEVAETSKIVETSPDEEIKIINIDIGASVESFGDIDDNSDNDSTDDENSVVEVEDTPLVEQSAEPVVVELDPVESQDDNLDRSVDYKRMEVSYLRELVLSRGLFTDPKKLKKGDLIKLLTDE